jgi:ketosteroid isomerase-like protein
MNRLVIAWVAGTVLAGAATAQPADPLLAQVQAADEALAAAHGRGDMETYLKGLSDDYLYIDIGGKRVTKAEITRRRAADKRLVTSSEASEDEAIRVSDNAVLLRGREISGDSRWTALWVREADGQWRVLAETSTPVRDDSASPYARVKLPAGAIEAHAGKWALELAKPITLALAVEGQSLVGTLSSDTEARFTFVPHAPGQFHALERDFQLKFAPDGRTLTLVTWGTPTRGTRH